MTKITYIPGEIANAAIDEQGNRKPVTRTHHIFDDAKDKNQAEINAEVDNTFAFHQSEINALDSQNYVTVDTFGELPATGVADTIYRVANYDGTQVVTNRYAEYAWNGTRYKLLDVKEYGIDDEPTAGSDNLIKSGGVFTEFNKLNDRFNNCIDSIAGFNILGDSRESVFRQALIYAWVEKLTDDAPTLPETMFLRYFRNNNGAIGAFFQIFASLSDENPIFSWYEAGPLSDIRTIIVSGYGVYSGKYRFNIRVDWSKVVVNFVSNNPYITITSANLNRELVSESKTIETTINEIGDKVDDTTKVAEGLVTEVDKFIDPLSGFDITGEREIEIRDAIKYCYLKVIDSSVSLPENLSLIYLTNRNSSPSGCLIQVVEKGTENIVFSWYDAGPKTGIQTIQVNGFGNYQNKYALIFNIDYSLVAEKMVWITSPIHLNTSLLNRKKIEDNVSIPKHIGTHTNVFYGKNIVFFGDSITEFKDNNNKRYSDYIKEFTGANVYNGAIGGSQLRMRYTAQYVKITGTASTNGEIVLNINNKVRKTASVLTTDSVNDIALKIKNGNKTGSGGFYFAIDPEYPDEIVIITNTDEYGALVTSDNVSIETETGVTFTKQYYSNGMFKNFFGDEAITQAYSNLDIASMIKSFALNYWTLSESAANYLSNRGDDNMDIINEMKTISIADTDMVVILGGTNDFNESSFGVAGESGKHTLSSYITDIISTLLHANNKLKVVFLTPIPRYYYASAENPLSSWQDKWWGDNCISRTGEVDEGNGWSIRLVNAITEGVKFHHIPIYDLYWTIGWNKWNFREFFNDDDGTHPYKGMKQLAEKIMEYLYNIKI